VAITLDDVAGTVLECVLRGDIERLDDKSGPETIPRICPFISITAAEIYLYAALCGFGDGETLSPEQGNGLHKDTIAMLDNFTHNHPATKYALLNLGEKLANSAGRITGLIQACEWYGKYPQGCCDDDSAREVMNGTY
jgi:tRNA(Ile)-lysidine synthase TilS/MesJ